MTAGPTDRSHCLMDALTDLGFLCLMFETPTCLDPMCQSAIYPVMHRAALSPYHLHDGQLFHTPCCERPTRLFSPHEPCQSGIERIVWNHGCCSDHRCQSSDVVSTCDEAEEIPGAKTRRPGTSLVASIYLVWLARLKPRSVIMSY
jgi:hypothetical protein